MNSEASPVIINDPISLRQYVSREKQNGKRIGLVPTMGALHEGHLSLVQKSIATCDITIVSIFVNPTQFAPHEDFEKYPRTLENDGKLLKTCGGNVTIFCPSIETMYPAGFDTYVEVGGVSRRLEGESRPTHFRGVATIVMKLFMLVQPDTAFFGQKDFQQCAIIQKMVEDLNIPVTIQICPIIREPDGLAMSSRNQYLLPEERKQAVVLSESLSLAKKMYQQGCTSAEIIREAMTRHLLTAEDAEIDYIAMIVPETFEECSQIRPNTVILLAVRIGETRLIDNIVLID